MQLFEKLFTGVALLGAGVVGKTYYEKHYMLQVPKNHHAVVKDRRNSQYATNEPTVMLLPFWQKAELLLSKERFQIKSKAASKDKEVVNVHLLVDSELKDVLKAYGKYGLQVEATIRQRLAKEIKQACQEIHSKQSNRSELKKSLEKQLVRRLTRSLSKDGIELSIQALDCSISEPLKLRYMPELLI